MVEPARSPKREIRTFIPKKDEIEGKIRIPASKSHTIRAVVIASLAEGTSRIINPLNSADTISAANACSALGAKIEIKVNSKSQV